MCGLHTLGGHAKYQLLNSKKGGGRRISQGPNFADMPHEMQNKTTCRQDDTTLESIYKVFIISEAHSKIVTCVKYQQPVHRCMLFPELFSVLEITYNKLSLKVENKNYVPHGVILDSRNPRDQVMVTDGNHPLLPIQSFKSFFFCVPAVRK